MRKPTGYVIYRGPSLLDGAPIVAVAITKSGNRKTGNMVQTYILVDGVNPLEAARDGRDAAVCGDCRHRPKLGGACYVTLMHGPRAVHDGLQRGIYPLASDHPDVFVRLMDIAKLGKDRKVRLGTYGDPAAVPVQIWESLVSRAAGHTGYTHQWNNPKLSGNQLQRLYNLVMASVDDEQEAQQARDAGLRYFRVRMPGEPVNAGEIVCPASEEAGRRRTCETCRACSGTTRGVQQASVVIIVHGMTAGRFAQGSLFNREVP